MRHTGASSLLRALPDGCPPAEEQMVPSAPPPSGAQEQIPTITAYKCYIGCLWAAEISRARTRVHVVQCFLLHVLHGFPYQTASV